MGVEADQEGRYVCMKEDTFACQEARNLKIEMENWKQRYLFFDLHEPFFAKFSTVLYQWLKQQVEINTIRPY